MSLKLQRKALKERMSNLRDHCSFHTSDKNAKVVLKALAKKAKKLKELDARDSAKEDGVDSPVKVRKTRVKKEKVDNTRSPELCVKINTFLESRASIKAASPIGELV